jgi:hypothetical protein
MSIEEKLFELQSEILRHRLDAEFEIKFSRKICEHIDDKLRARAAYKVANVHNHYFKKPYRFAFYGPGGRIDIKELEGE